MTKQTLLSCFFNKNSIDEKEALLPLLSTSIPVVDDDDNAGNETLNRHTVPDGILGQQEITSPKPKSESNSSSVQLVSDRDSPLSEYEQLRLRNMKRNHERLVSLGLVDPAAPTPGSSISKTSKPPKQRKRKKVANAVSPEYSMPLRRSTRRTPSSQTASQIKNSMISLNDSSQNQTPTTTEHMHTEEEAHVEEFQDSALVTQMEYSTRTSSIVTSSRHQGALNSLSPIGPRLLSPKANLALYSLNIYSNNADVPLQWIVGAGKSGIVSIWNCHQEPTDEGIDSVITWKAHGGRWISDACFIPSRDDGNSPQSNDSSHQCPSNLLTAANDGTICLWDLRSSSSSTGAPKNLATTGKKLHTGGIFSMHVDIHGSNYNDMYVCTGSKDKSLAVTTLDSISSGGMCLPIFVSHHHSSKVGCVHLQGKGSALIGSASDDGIVAIHDFRDDKVVADIDFAHDKPHSIVWNPYNPTSFITAGYDNTIHSWDHRNLKEPVQSFVGHVPVSTKRCKRIHRPCFLYTSNGSSSTQFEYILSGSESSGCLSIFDFGTDKLSAKDNHVSVFSRGHLPMDCGDAGCIAVQGSNVAVAVDGGDVLLLQPNPIKG